MCKYSSGRYRHMSEVGAECLHRKHITDGAVTGGIASILFPYLSYKLNKKGSVMMECLTSYLVLPG